MAPLALWTAPQEFMRFLKDEYVDGAMWLRGKGTYTQHVVEKLRTTCSATFGAGEYVVVSMPSRVEVKGCQGRLSIVARGITLYWRSQFPSCSVHTQMQCFQIDTASCPSDRKRSSFGLLKVNPQNDR